jgi:hypothetical protein
MGWLDKAKRYAQGFAEGLAEARAAAAARGWRAFHKLHFIPWRWPMSLPRYLPL